MSYLCTVMIKKDNCINCKLEKHIMSRGVCSTCYRILYAPKGECERCNNYRPISTKGFCASCTETLRIHSSTEKELKRYEYNKEYFSREENKQKEKERLRKRREDPEYIEKKKRSDFLRRLKNYGISEEFYIEECEKGCQICGLKERLHIDHCHETSKYRGILCGKCNNALGLFNDNPDLIINALEYIKEHIK